MIKSFVNYFVFSIISSGLGFLTVVYLTHHITPKEYGIIGLFMAVLYILPSIVSFGTDNLVSINKVTLKNKQFLTFSRHLFSFSFLNFLIIFFISLFIGSFFKNYLILFFLIPIIAFFQFLIGFHRLELVQNEKSKLYGIYNLLLAISMFLLTVLFVSVFKLSWDGRLLALFISNLVLLIIMYYYSFDTIKYFKFKLKKEKLKEFVLFGLPVLIGFGAGWLLNQSDRFIVLHFFTLKDVGIYTVAYSLGIIINLINQAMVNSIVPYLYRSLNKKEGHKIVKKLNIYYSLIIFVLAFMIGVGAKWYVPLLFGEKYIEGVNIIFIIAIAFGFNGIYRMTGMVIAFYKKNTLRTILIYFSAICNVIFSILLIPFFGILSPAIGTLIAYMLLAFLSYYFGWKILIREENVKR
jgi:O-antigen/teichoic acid export membrane protein